MYMPSQLRRHDDADGTTSLARWQVLAALTMRDRAVQASEVSFSVCDALAADQPLVWVNEAFTSLTGYAFAEVVGRNCRFLASPDASPVDRAALGAAVLAQRPAVVTILNRRKDGSEFWNDVSLSPVRDEMGMTTHFVGVQVDVTARVLADARRAQALLAEQAARQDADRANRRLALLAEASRLLALTLDVQSILDQVVALAVPAFAEWAVLLLPVATVTTGPGWLTAHLHRDAGQALLLGEHAEQLTARLPDARLPGLLASNVPTELTIDCPVCEDCPDVDRQVHLLGRNLGVTAVQCIPLVARGHRLGVLLLGLADQSQTLSGEMRTLAADLGGRTALAIQTAQMYGREHQIALGLQRSLLPALPELPGLLLAAQYLPSDQDVQVGGDWWDVFALPDGATGLAIGDVMGHDITAAAAMGQLRSVLRTCAWAGSNPAQVLDQLDQLVQHFDMAQFATCVYARLEPATLLNGRLTSRLCWASAGHLPILLQRADRSTVTLTGGRGLPIGVPGASQHQQAYVDLYAGDSVLLFTDGLIETRAGDIDRDVERLVQQLRRHRPEDGPQVLVDQLTAGLGALEDDIAVLAVQLTTANAFRHPTSGS